MSRSASSRHWAAPGWEVPCLGEMGKGSSIGRFVCRTARTSLVGWLPVGVLGTVVALALVAGPVQGQAQPTPSAAPPDRPLGEFLYLRDCAFCHGNRGEGTPSGVGLQSIGPAEVDYTLTTGRMPVSKPGEPRRRRPSAYTPEETAALVDYMRPFIARSPDIPHVEPDAGDLGEGGQLYRALCAACHQWAGQGGALLGGINSPHLKDSTPLQIAEAIRAGPVNMPSFVLTDHQVDSIVRYVLYLRDPEDRGGNGLWHFGPLPEGAVAWVFGLGAVLMLSRWIGTRG
jgi:ubiquinol-cytochrome c reductase cytochrome c subunit